jgi:hypothetical protein
MGVYAQELFRSTYDEAAKDGHRWYKKELDNYKEQIEGVEKWLERRTAAYRVDTVEGRNDFGYPDSRGVTIDNYSEKVHFAKNKRQLRKICQQAVYAGDRIVAVYDVKGNVQLQVGWAPHFRQKGT